MRTPHTIQRRTHINYTHVTRYHFYGGYARFPNLEDKKKGQIAPLAAPTTRGQEEFRSSAIETNTEEVELHRNTCNSMEVELVRIFMVELAERLLLDIRG